MRARHKIFPPILLLGAVLLHQPTFASPRVAPLVPTFRPEKAQEIVTRFHDAIAKGLKTSKIPILSASTVRAKAPRPCSAATCAEQSRVHLGVRSVVYGRIDTTGKNYTIELTLQPGNVRVAGRCDICTLREALGTTGRLANKLGKDNRASLLASTALVTKKLPEAKRPVKPSPVKPSPGTPSPGTPGTPSPGTPSPGTPGPGTPSPGTPSPGAPSPGTPSPGTPGPGTTAEDPPAGTTPPGAGVSRTPWPLWPTLAAAGAGIVGLAVGIPLLAMNGDFTGCRGAPLPDGRNCEDRYSTSGAGWAFTVMGIAGLATSGVLFYLYLDSQDERQATRPAAQSAWSRISLLPTPDGFLIHTGGTF